MKLLNYSIMPLIPDKIDVICADIERQVKERVLQAISWRSTARGSERV